MIELKVEDYCQDCPRFEADVQCQQYYSMDYMTCATTVKCKFRKQCRNIMKYLKEQSKKEK